MKDNTKFKERFDLIQPLSQLLDLFSVAAAGVTAYLTRDFPIPVNPNAYIIAIAFGVLYATIVFRLFGTYSAQNNYKIQYPLQRIIISWLTVLALLALTAYISKTGEYFSRLWFALWAIYGFLLLLTFKIVFLGLLNSSYFRNWNHKNIVLVGTEKHSNLVSSRIKKANIIGFNLLGYVNTDKSHNDNTAFNLQNLGELKDLNSWIQDAKIDEIWITVPLKDEDTIKEILYLLRHSTINIRMIPDIFELRLLNQSISDIAGIPVINLCESPMSGVNLLYKFLEDKFLSLFILLLCLPIFLVIAIIIKLTSKGPIFYLQDRIGWNGKIFKIIKFRTMPVDAEVNSGPVWSTAEDNRATAFGAFLRRTSLDELPQFLNVLMGDMSIVGPRPERPEFVHEFKELIPGYMKKHMVKAGITGWAQINGWRGDTDLQSRISHDLYYIENWSLMLDLKIIALTAMQSLIQIKP